MPSTRPPNGPLPSSGSEDEFVLLLTGARDNTERLLRSIGSEITDYTLIVIGIRRETWWNLAERPSEFGERLDRQLRLAKRRIKKEFGIPSHRPIRNQDRDREIWALRELQPHLSWGCLDYGSG